VVPDMVHMLGCKPLQAALDKLLPVQGERWSVTAPVTPYRTKPQEERRETYRYYSRSKQHT